MHPIGSYASRCAGCRTNVKTIVYMGLRAILGHSTESSRFRNSGARVSPFEASTQGGGRPRAPRDGVRACIAAWASEGVVIRNEVE
eukprot:6190188-Pleurochrysis_carterae.AAC.2